MRYSMEYIMAHDGKVAIYYQMQKLVVPIRLIIEAYDELVKYHTKLHRLNDMSMEERYAMVGTEYTGIREWSYCNCEAFKVINIYGIYVSDYWHRINAILKDSILRSLVEPPNEDENVKPDQINLILNVLLILDQ